MAAHYIQRGAGLVPGLRTPGPGFIPPSTDGEIGSSFRRKRKVLGTASSEEAQCALGRPAIVSTGVLRIL